MNRVAGQTESEIQPAKGPGGRTRFEVDQKWFRRYNIGTGDVPLGRVQVEPTQT